MNQDRTCNDNCCRLVLNTWKFIIPFSLICICLKFLKINLKWNQSEQENKTEFSFSWQMYYENLKMMDIKNFLCISYCWLGHFRIFNFNLQFKTLSFKQSAWSKNLQTIWYIPWKGKFKRVWYKNSFSNIWEMMWLLEGYLHGINWK